MENFANDREISNVSVSFFWMFYIRFENVSLITLSELTVTQHAVLLLILDNSCGGHFLLKQTLNTFLSWHFVFKIYDVSWPISILRKYL